MTFCGVGLYPYGGPGDTLRFLAGRLQDELPLLHDR